MGTRMRLCRSTVVVHCGSLRMGVGPCRTMTLRVHRLVGISVLPLRCSQRVCRRDGARDYKHARFEPETYGMEEYAPVEGVETAGDPSDCAPGEW